VHFQIWSFTYIAGYLSCRMTDIEGFLTIYGHSDNLLNNNMYIYVHWQLECYVVTLENSVHERFVIISLCFMVTFIILTKMLSAAGFAAGVKILTNIVYNVFGNKSMRERG